jgi:hypothetical protein
VRGSRLPATPAPRKGIPTETRAGRCLTARETASGSPCANGSLAALDVADGFGAYSVREFAREGPARSSVTVTRVAHSTVLRDFDGAVVLTDPWSSERAMYHRGEPLAGGRR